MKIRNVTESDIPAIASIYADAYNSLNIGEKWTKETAEELMKYFFKEQSDLFFLCEDEGQVVGATVALVKPWWDGNHITDGEIFVRTDYQGKGVGKKLLKALFTESKKKYEALSWDTFTHRVYEHPLKWYKDIGFEEIKHWVMITGDIDKVLSKLED